MIKLRSLIEIPLFSVFAIDIVLNISSFRYIKYALIAYFILCYLIFYKPQVEKSTTRYIERFLGFYLICILLNYSALLIDSTYFIRYLAESIFIIGPLISVWIINKFISIDDIFLNRLFFVLVISYGLKIVLNLESFLLYGFPSSWNELAMIIFNSRFGLESSTSFTFGLFTVFYFGKKKWFYFFLALLGVILGFKRIVILALILVGIAYLIFKNFRLDHYKRGIALTFVLLNVITIYLIISLINDPEFSRLVSNTTSLSVNHITMGRQGIYSNIIDRFGHPTFFTGIGLGHTGHIISSIYSQKITNFHSDLLKFVYEFGILLFINWIYILYRYNSMSIGNLLNIIFINIIFLTDNVLIYYFFMLVCYLIALNWIQHHSPPIESPIVTNREGTPK